jgi:hypothetical protein
MIEDLKIKLMVHPSHSLDPLVGLFPKEDRGNTNRTYQNIESFNAVATSSGPTGKEKIPLDDKKVLALQNTRVQNDRLLRNIPHRHFKRT